MRKIARFNNDNFVFEVTTLPISEMDRSKLLMYAEQINIHDVWHEKDPGVWEAPHIMYRDNRRGNWHYMCLDYKTAPAGTFPTLVQGVWATPDKVEYFEEEEEGDQQ